MNVVDSSGWLENFADDRIAEFFAPSIEGRLQSAERAVPTPHQIRERYEPSFSLTLSGL